MSSSNMRLRELIKAVRACKTSAEERAVISRESAKIRTSFAQVRDAFFFFFLFRLPRWLALFRVRLFSSLLAGGCASVYPAHARGHALLAQQRVSRNGAKKLPRGAIEAFDVAHRMTRQNETEMKPRNIAKLLYIHMLGYPTQFGALETIALCAQPQVCHFAICDFAFLGSL